MSGRRSIMREQKSLPAAGEQYAGSQNPPSVPEAEFEEAAIPLSHYLWILRRHRWKILSFVAACVIAALIISSRLTPIYESTATIDIDRQTPTGVIGQEATRSMMNDADQFLATQIKLIQSDSVLRPVAQKYKLLEAEGARAESAGIQPARVVDAPVELKRLKVMRPPNTYLLLISYRSSDPRLAADVANAIAQSYLEHTYNIRYRSSASLSAFMEKQLEELKAKMERSSAALAQFERELNVINPEEKTSILSSRLLQLNTEYTNAQAERVRKEAAYQSVRSGKLEAAQVSTQGESLQKLTERLNEAQERFAEVRTHFGANHPEHRKAAAQVAEVQRLLEKTRQNIAERVEIEYGEATQREEMLRKAVAETKAEFDRLNARSFEYQSLKREAEADKQLYEELVRKIKEAGINASFQNSSIRIADTARPALKPVFPNIKLNLLLAFLF
jgi:succinoglycan biosynthesis transport protein ExoP